MKRSKNIDELATALSAMQAEITDVEKNKNGYNYKYADIEQILEISRPLLNKFGLAITQLVCSNRWQVGIETVVMHKSGQFISSKALVTVEKEPRKSLAQAAGSTITYLRRYALAAALNICQIDNDGRSDAVEPMKESINVKLANELSKLIDDEAKKAQVSKVLDKYRARGLSEVPTEVLTKMIQTYKNFKEAANV